MIAYLDASVLVSLFAADASTMRAEDFLRKAAPTLIVSDFAGAEFVSAISRLVRMRIVSEADARIAFQDFDVWTSRAVRHVPIDPADVAAADAYLRRLDLNLRAPDALHIAIAQRVGAELVTFDDKMADAARALGAPTASA